jgi:hypothetical protein
MDKNVFGFAGMDEGMQEGVYPVVGPDGHDCSKCAGAPTCPILHIKNDAAAGGFISSLMAGRNGGQTIFDESGNLLAFACEDEGQTKIGIPLEHYSLVAELLKERKSIAETRKYRDEFLESVEVFKRVFGGDSSAYASMPQTGKEKILLLKNDLVEFVGELLDNIREMAQEDHKDLSPFINEAAKTGKIKAGENQYSVLISEAFEILKKITEADFENWIIDKLARNEKVSDNPYFEILNAAVESFVANTVNPIVISILTDDFQMRITNAESRESQILDQLPGELHNVSEAPHMKISMPDLIEAAKRFAESKKTASETAVA